MITRTVTLAFLLVCLPTISVLAQTDEAMPIGVIQGSGATSPYLNETVTFDGIVTGAYEDRNTRGITYYTVFVQDEAGTTDDDPATSDGIAVFLGRQQPEMAVGDRVRVQGDVTEFFGLTEIEDNGLSVERMGSGQPLPAPVVLEPPADDESAAAYYEALEGMRVTLDEGRVVGPTYAGCGFAVVPAESEITRVLRDEIADPFGPVVPVLHHSDVVCDDFPNVRTGDVIEGLTGPLTYSFDLFRLVHQQPEALTVLSEPLPTAPEPPAVAPGQFSIASFNIENYFDTVDDTGDPAEPKPTEEELATRQAKVVYAIDEILGCPTLLGIQEVENEPLLLELANQVAVRCGFTYEVTHRESADARGIDVALLSDPRQVTVEGARLRQTCVAMSTDIEDPNAGCDLFEDPLFSRPPLQVTVTIGLDESRATYTLFVNHFKSKVGGELETAPERLAQAEHLRQLADEALASDPDMGVIVLGDFNDYPLSPAMQAMTGENGLTNAMLLVPEAERYSYIFNGASQLIDGILLSPALADQLVAATIIHVNADYPDALAADLSPEGLPYKSSDHDIPFVVLAPPQQAEPLQTVEPTQVVRPTDRAVTQDVLPTQPAEPPQTVEPVVIKEEVPDAPPWALISLGVIFLAVISYLVMVGRKPNGNRGA